MLWQTQKLDGKLKNILKTEDESKMSLNDRKNKKCISDNNVYKMMN